jgi:lambda repressor-like predicted transcriptional regulator
VRKALDKPSRRMELAIAEKIGLPPEDIWPERYRA